MRAGDQTARPGTVEGPQRAMRGLVAGILVTLATERARGYTVRVVAATELRLEPSVASDGRLSVAVHLRNDQLSPVRQGVVTVRAGGAEGTVVTDQNGDGEVTLSPMGGRQVFQFEAEYPGDPTSAPATASIRVNSAAPFVTADLTVPPVVALDAPDARIPAVVTVRTGESRLLPSLRLWVDITADDRQVVAGQTDASGRAVFQIPARAFGPVGVRRLRPEVSVLSDTVAGTERNIIVRARTALTLRRVQGIEGLVVTGALASRLGPVPGAPVRLLRGERTLAGAVTDSRGTFEVHLGTDLLADPDTALQAVFEPTEPWWIGARSPVLLLSPPPAPVVSWAWEVLPLVFGAAVLGLGVARSRALPPALAVPRSPALPSVVPWVEAVTAGGTVLRVRIVATDRSTGVPLPDAYVRTGREGAWMPAAVTSTELAPARRIELEVSASGYAPAVVRADFPRLAEYVIRVSLRTWREELFDRARGWIRDVARRGGALTPREALASAASPAEEAGTRADLVDLVEAGCYGPEPPGAREVARADGLLAVIRSAPQVTPPRGER